MRRILSLCLILALLGSFCGCREETAAPEDTVEFYYLRTSYVYGTEDGVIAPEIREIGNRSNTMLYLLTLYLQGPLDSDLQSPFPDGCKMLGISRDGNTLCVTLDYEFAKLQGMELTIACACIARTCFSMSDVTQVQVKSESKDDHDSVNVVISIDSLLLDDNSGLPQHTITEESQ